MLDSVLKPYLEPHLDKIGGPIVNIGLRPSQIGAIAFVFGLCGCFTVAMGNYIVGLLLILLSRAIDAVAVKSPLQSDFGDYLRVTLEWILYSAFVFFFALSNTTHYMAASFLLFTYIMLAVSVLSYKVIAAKRAQVDDESAMLLFHPARLVERAEILAFIILSCIIPSAFSAFAMLFGLLALVTAGGWIFKAYQNF